MKLFKIFSIGIIILSIAFFCKSITHVFFSTWLHGTSLPFQAYVNSDDNTNCCSLVTEANETGHFIKVVVPNFFKILNLYTSFFIFSVTVFSCTIILLYCSSIRRRFGSFKVFESYGQHFRLGLIHPKIY